MECRVEPHPHWRVASENGSDDANQLQMDTDTTTPIDDSDKQPMPPPKLPTPMTVVDEPPDNTVTLTDELSLTDFLRDILQPGQEPVDTGNAERPGSSWHNHGMYTPRNLMDIGQDLSMDFNDFDGAFMDGWDAWLDPSLASLPFDKPTERMSVSDVSTPSIDESIGMGSAAFKRSAWQWTPNHENGKYNRFVIELSNPNVSKSAL